MALIALDQVAISFGSLPILDRINLQVEDRERVCIIGRNGAGKSTLLRIIRGNQAADSGSIWRQPGMQLALLVQDVPLSADRPVFDVVAEGLGDLSDLVSRYHHAAMEVSEHGTPALLDKLGALQHELEEWDGWRLEQRVELILSRLKLPTETIVDTLSGGWRRRVLLARALVSQPDLLLLDEPTNHLDLEAIQWLESFLADYPGSVLFITHDRAFLRRLATRIVELDRGALTSWPGNYETFLRKKEEWFANEALQNEKYDKRLAGEEAWLRKGVKARRTRNEGRVKALMAMRAERAARRELTGNARIQVELADQSGRLVFEAKHIGKSFDAKPVIADFSTRILRGDRIGLIGPNGAGKTTLLRLLLGELEPDSGEVMRGVNLQVAYYDQQREQLDPDQTVFDTIGEGSEIITINGKPRHVNGYLRDFLFQPEHARSPVRALSGGERNRLLLARLFTRPANVLVLDEPTNDLDLETLELLESQLLEFPGTLLLVSHDRAFLDNVVTSTLVFEGEGRVQEYAGGYEDWLRQKPPNVPPAVARTRNPRANSGSPAADAPRPGMKKKLSYNEQRELEQLPGRIADLEAEQESLNRGVAHPEFYREPADAIKQTLARIGQIQGELIELYTAWDDLDSRSKQ
jgi:ATP-binding cassette subfamily F protein uup